MADETNEQHGNESEGSRLRRQLEEALEENKTLKAERREQAFKDAGLDPKRGIGRAVAKLYEGDADVEAIREFAKDEFEWQPPTGDGDGEQLSPEEQQRLEGEQRVQGVANSALPPRTPSDADRIQEAETNGDWDTANRLKAQQLEALRS